MATTALEATQVWYDDQDVNDFLARQRRELNRQHKKDSQLELDALMDTIKSNQAKQVGGAVVGGAILEVAAQAVEYSDFMDTGVSAVLGGVGFGVAMMLDEDSPGWASAALGMATAASGRAGAGVVRMIAEARRDG